MAQRRAVAGWVVAVAGLAGLAAGCHPPAAAPLTCDSPGAICTIAGEGTLGYNGEGLPAEDTWLFFPSALARLPDGRLVIDDFNNMLVRVLEPDGTLSTLAGDNLHAYAVEGPADASPLENPVDVAAGPDGAVYIAELHAARVLRVDPDGWLEVLAGTGEPGFSGDGGPATEAALSESAGVAVGEDGAVYISDTDNHCLRVVHPDGTITTLAGGGGPGVAEPGIDLDGAAFHAPQRVRAAGDALYVADAGNHVIRRVDLARGVVEVVAGTGEAGSAGDGGPATAAALRSPTSAVPGPDGSLYIADSGNHAIRRLDPDGTLTTVVGVLGEPGHEDGPLDAAAAHLDWPADVLVEPDGDLVIADMLNSRVRRVAGLAAPSR